MDSARNLHIADPKRKPPTRARRAQDLIAPVRHMIPTQWKNTRDTDVVSRYVGATRPSTSDIVLDDHEDRLMAIESRLGIRKPVGRQPLRIGNLAKRYLAPAAKAIGMPWLTWYNLRHTASTNMDQILTVLAALNADLMVAVSATGERHTGQARLGGGLRAEWWWTKETAPK